jgi:hypothetical protein
MGVVDERREERKKQQKTRKWKTDAALYRTKDTVTNMP